MFVVPLPSTSWGEGFGECSTCRTDGDATWSCPAAVSTYADIGGIDADIVQVELVGGERTRRPMHVVRCVRKRHLRREEFSTGEERRREVHELRVRRRMLGKMNVLASASMYRQCMVAYSWYESGCQCADSH